MALNKQSYHLSDPLDHLGTIGEIKSLKKSWWLNRILTSLRDSGCPVRFSCWYSIVIVAYTFIIWLQTSWTSSVVTIDHKQNITYDFLSWDAYTSFDLMGLAPPERYSYLNRYTSNLSSSSDEAFQFIFKYFHENQTSNRGNNTFVIPHVNHIIN